MTEMHESMKTPEIKQAESAALKKLKELYPSYLSMRSFINSDTNCLHVRIALSGESFNVHPIKMPSPRVWIPAQLPRDNSATEVRGRSCEGAQWNHGTLHSFRCGTTPWLISLPDGSISAFKECEVVV